MADKSVSATRTVPAPPEKVFALLRDPSMHSVIDGSGHVTGTRSTAKELSLGDKFTTSNRIVLPYLISNTVVEFEEDSLIAWRPFAGHRWRWELQDLGDGTTRVTETFDWSRVRQAWIITLLRFPAKNLQGIRATLDRLEKTYPVG